MRRRRTQAPPPWAELPDHLVVMLAFAAVAPPGYDEQVLGPAPRRARAAAALAARPRQPLRDLLDAIAACLPELSVTDRADVARLAREGPPEEAVGLEPYAPAEAM